jgi:hypothetical protein
MNEVGPPDPAGGTRKLQWGSGPEVDRFQARIFQTADSISLMKGEKQ